MAEIDISTYLFHFKGCYFASNLITPEYLEEIADFEVRDSDIFVITFPKSGSVWVQNILCLILNESHRNGTGEKCTYEQAPFLDYNIRNVDLSQLPSPRVLMAHLPYHLIPKGLKEGKGKIIYVYRNPKDAMVSLYHYSSFVQKSADLEEYMQKYLAGKVVCGSIFDHVKAWYSHKNELDILFLCYEEMIKDLRGAVLKVCGFIGKHLSSQEVDKVVEMATFENMKRDPRANHVAAAKERFWRKDILHLRKGTIGDWKNIMTVSQSERFDKVFQEKMKDVPLKFIWDIKEIQNHD